MSVSLRKNRGRSAQGVALAALICALAPLGAFADEAERPDLAPLVLAPSTAVDMTPTSTSTRIEHRVTHLDLSPPAGLMVDLPPEAVAPRIFVEPPPATTEVTPLVEPKLEALQPGPPPVAYAAPDAAAAVAKPEAPPRDATPTPPASEAARELPAPAAEAPVAVTPDALHAALDAWVAARPARLLGASDPEAVRRAVAAVYAERAYAPLWIESDGLGGRARSALARLARADEDGLTPPPVASKSPAEAEIALSAAVVAYAMQASGGRIVPRLLSKDITASPPVADPAAALKAVSAATDPGDALEAFNPPHPEYRALRAALAGLRAQPQAPVAQISALPALKLGMSDPRVPLIRARFGLGADSPAAQVYDVRLASAVAAFQRVHGLQGGGALTAATAEAISGDADLRKARRLIANMEMWRWLPRDLGDTRVEVNVPDFALKVTSHGEIVHRARVIVGKPDTPTPIFSNFIRFLLVNPAWHVPESIIKKEMAPKFAADPSYFERHGYKVSYAGDKMVVEQPPGEANALGRILFLFPNEHAVYLHDTPQRYLFAQSFRALSHGCVRVEDPARLAEVLMGGARRGWTQDRIRSLLGDTERTYALPVPIPVHLEYFTEVLNERGEVEGREDLYGLTAKVMAALGLTRRD